MITSKFRDIPVDGETKILSREQLCIDDLDCLHEYWSWDGFYAESLIFLKQDVLNMSEKELIDFSSRFWKNESSQITFSDKGKFVFINFNFQTEDEEF